MSTIVLLAVCVVPAKAATPPPPPAAGSPYTPNPAAARYWLHRFFPPKWVPLMMCVAYHESRYELAATNWPNVGPWQVNLTAHPWVDGYRIRRSWRYAAWVSKRIAWHPVGRYYDFGPWRPDCGIVS